MTTEILATRGPQSNLIKNIDYVVDPRKPFCVDSIKKASTILITVLFKRDVNQHMRHMEYFLSKILPTLTKPINLVIAGADQTFPNSTDIRQNIPAYPEGIKILFQHPFINKIFVENLDCSTPNAIPIPCGVNTHQSTTDPQYFLKHENIDQHKPLKITNFNVTRHVSAQFAERHYVNHLCQNLWKENYIGLDIIKQSRGCRLNKSLKHGAYLQSLSEYMFTVCSHGGGLDVNPKLWESLLVGTIPIIMRNKPYTDIYKDHDLPVVVVKDWYAATIDIKKLKHWRDQYYHYFTDPNKRRDMLHKLSVDYWVTYIKNI